MQLNDYADDIDTTLEDDIESEELEPRDPLADDENDEELDDDDAAEDDEAGDEDDQDGDGESQEGPAESLEIGGKTYSMEQVEEAIAASEIAETNQQAFQEERSQLDNERTQIAEVRQYVGAGYAALQQTVQALIPEEPSMALASSDPQAYAMQTEQRKLVMDHLNQVLAGAQQFGQGAQQIDAGEMQRVRNREEMSLVNKRPALRDPAKRAAYTKQIIEAAESLGFTREDVEATTDHRLLLALGHVHADLKAKSNRKQAGKRVTKRPTKSAKRAAPTQQQTARRAKAAKRAQQTGSIDDAIAAIM